MTGHAGLTRRERRLVDGGDLGHADAGDDARGADRARSDADLDGIHARIDERLGALARGDVAADDVDVGEARVGLDPADDVDDARGLAVRGVDDEHVDAGVAQRLGALPGVAEEADGGADAQATLLVLGGERILLALVEVLDGDEARRACPRRR